MVINTPWGVSTTSLAQFKQRACLSENYRHRNAQFLFCFSPPFLNLRNPPTSFSPSAQAGQTLSLCWPCSVPTRDSPCPPPGQPRHFGNPNSIQEAGGMLWLTPMSLECQNLTSGTQHRVTNAHPLETCRTNPFLHKLHKNKTPPSPPQIPESNLDLDT